MSYNYQSLGLQLGQVIMPNEKNKIITALGNEIKLLRDEIKSGNLKGAALEAARRNEKALQDMINRFLAKTGVITPAENDSAINALDESKKLRLGTQYRKEMKRLGLFVLGLTIAGVGVWLYYKKNK